MVVDVSDKSLNRQRRIVVIVVREADGTLKACARQEQRARVERGQLLEVLAHLGRRRKVIKPMVDERRRVAQSERRMKSAIVVARAVHRVKKCLHFVKTQLDDGYVVQRFGSFGRNCA